MWYFHIKNLGTVIIPFIFYFQAYFNKYYHTPVDPLNNLSITVICVLSGSLKNGKILPVGQQLWDVNSSATFKCDDGYIIQGADSIKCQADGGFSDRVPVCGKS